MTDEELRELATEMILDHARDIEWLSINERLPEGLSDVEADAAAKKIDDFIVKATITVELPGGEAPTGEVETSAQQLRAEQTAIREYAEHLIESMNSAYAKAGRELLAILAGGVR